MKPRANSKTWMGGIALAASLAVTPVGYGVEITLPPETAKLVESPLPGYALAQAMCLTCHSADYLKMQPVSSRAFWQGSVTKMQKVFGAPIPDDAVAPLVDYLAKTYGSERAPEKTVNPKKRLPAPPASK
jgi:hypothetical protein